MNVEVINIISLIASIATLILFVIYFIGRIWTIISMRWVCQEKLTVMYGDFDRQSFDIIDGINCEYGKKNDKYAATLIFTSVQGIYDFKVYECDFDLLKGVTEKREIAYFPFVNVGKSIEITAYLPEIGIRHMVEFTTNDFKKVQMSLVENPKSGVISEYLNAHHTWRSILFYLFK